MKNLLLLLLLCGVLNAQAGDYFRTPKRSVSRSGQFTIYCDDDSVRFAVSSFAEEAKKGVLRSLGVKDEWKYPIIIQLLPPPTASPNFPKSNVQVYQNELGFKVQIDIALAGDLTKARFPHQLTRAVLLEFMHRGKANIEDGKPYAEPPAWLIEGFLLRLNGGASDAEMDVYKAAMNSGRKMSLHEFLAQNATDLDSTSQAFYHAYSYALLELLFAQPYGTRSMVRYLRSLPENMGDTPLDGLEGSFPALAADESTVEKWWSVNLARLAAADRYRGFTVEETEEHLTSALRAPLVSGTGEPPQFELAQYKEFIKKPGAKKTFQTMGEQLLPLQARTNALYRPVLDGYAEVLALLIKGRTKGIDQRLSALTAERQKIRKHLEDIADYLNWFELTQTDVSSNAFQGYLKLAESLKNQEPPKRNDAIAKYLNEVEKLME